MVKLINNDNLQIPAEYDVCVARDSDMKSVSEILASAFTHDPVVNWMCNHPEIYSTFFRFEAEALYKRYGHVYINGERTGAAMWLPPSIAAIAPFHWRLLLTLWKIASKGGISSLKRADQLDKFMSAKHNNKPHFYLRSIGTALDSQGRGIGSALLKAGLIACDQLGMPAHLESSNEKNNFLYERFGFKVTGEENLPEGGPAVWFMKRDAQK